MPLRHRVPVLIGATAAAAALLLGGCASSGTIGAKSTGGATGGSSSSPSDSSSTPPSTPSDSPSTPDSASDSTPSDSSSTPSDNSSADAMQQQLKMLAGLMTDPGCKQAVNALGDVIGMGNDPLKVAASFPQAIQKIRQGAATTKKPAAKTAITKLADDLQTMFDTAKKGGTPDSSMMEADGQAFGMACVS